MVVQIVASRVGRGVSPMAKSRGSKRGGIGRWRIAEKWEDFRKSVLSEDASDIQREAMKVAFYTGANAMLGLVKEDDSLDSREQLELEGLDFARRRWLGL
jgi:hypothetical protein